ncbi:hypothetical protein ACIQ1D_19115 [Lysinibacillus xylanilyticus]
MAVVGTIILIWVIAIIVWFALLPQFTRIGNKVVKHVEKAKNTDNKGVEK